MSKNCIACIEKERTGFDLLCNDCRKEKVTGLLETLHSTGNDSWARVELYRWQHDKLPTDNDNQEMIISKALSSAAIKLINPIEGQTISPLAVASVLMYLSKLELKDSPQ